MTNPDMSCMKSASISSNLSSLGFNITRSIGINGMDLFKKLDHNSLELIMPSNSNIFLIPRTKSTSSCFSDTKVDISNL